VQITIGIKIQNCNLHIRTILYLAISSYVKYDSIFSRTISGKLKSSNIITTMQNVFNHFTYTIQQFRPSMTMLSVTMTTHGSEGDHGSQ